MIGCANHGRLEIYLYEPPGAQPLKDVAEIRLMVDTPDNYVTATIPEGETAFDLSVDVEPDGKSHQIWLEAYTSDKHMISRAIAKPVQFTGKLKTALDLVLRPVGAFSPTLGSVSTVRKSFATLVTADFGQVYILGGVGADGKLLTITESYNFYPSSFSAGTDLLEGLTEMVVWPVGQNKFLLFGGITSDQAMNTNAYVVTVSKDGIETALLAEKGPPVASPELVAVNDTELLIVGGRDNEGNPLKSLYDVHVENFQWKKLPVELRYGRVNHASIYLEKGGKVLIVGGVEDAAEDVPAEVYDVADQSLSEVTIDDVAVRGILKAPYLRAAALSDGTCVTIGGKISESVFGSAVHILPECFQGGCAAFSLLTDLPSTALRFGHTTTVLSPDQILIAGGFCAAESLCADNLLLNYVEGKFVAESAGSFQTPRAYHTAMVLPDNTVFFLGGVMQNGNLSSDGEIYMPLKYP